MTAARVVLVSAPDAACALHLARTLLDKRLIACANVLPAVTSVFRWEGAVKQEVEVLLMLKTQDVCVEALCAWLNHLHPYAVPEVLVLPVTAGAPRYLQWIEDETAAAVRVPPADVAP